MATPIQMPALSPTMREGKITKWLKKEGDKVSSGEAVAECETDKSNLEIEAYEDGYLIQIVVKEGESAPVGAPIGYLGEKGEKVVASPVPPLPTGESFGQAQESGRVEGSTARAPTPSPPPPAREPVAQAQERSFDRAQENVRGAREIAPRRQPASVVPLRREAQGQMPDERLRASPLARRMAQDRGLDLARLEGSGPQGRIIKRDVEALLKQGAQPARVASTAAAVSFERRAPEIVALSSIRKVIAQRLTEVKPGVPHFYLTIEVEMDEAMKIRDEAKALETKASVNDIILKAAAIALRRMPQMNVSLQGDRLLRLHNVDVGVAVALDEGLITPVIRDADQKGLAAISAEARELAERARKRALRPEEYAGGSITVSNLGMYGIDSFVAVINPPQAAILAVGVVAEKPVVRNGQLAVRQMMSVTLSGDHRVIDGALGAEYLRELKGLLEHPMRLLF